MTDIAVVGAGFVGLSFAVAAARQGFAVEVFDKRSAPQAPTKLTSNVLAINPASTLFLQEEKVWDAIAEAYCTPYSEMTVRDGTGTGSVHFTAAEVGLSELGFIVDQSALLHALYETARGCSNLNLRWQSTAEIEPGEVPLLVGADGVHSSIRESLNLTTIGYDYNQTATVCVIETELPHGSCARQWFLEGGPLAMLPLSHERKVAVIWSSFDSRAALEEAAFIDAIEIASEGELGSIKSLGPRFEFSLRQQQALQYVAEGVALLGDAAHAIHPLAGQGANLGFADARALLTELTAARLEGREVGELDVLKRFERARKPENHLTAIAMEGFHRLFANELPWLSMLRSQGLRLFNGNETLKRLAIGFASH